MTCTLGIAQLPTGVQSVEPGALYAINCALLQETVQLCSTAMQTARDRACLVVEYSDEFHDLSSEELGEESYEVLVYEEKQPLLFNIPELVELLPKKNRDFYIFVVTGAVASIKNKDFDKAIRDISKAAKENDVGILLVFNNQNERSLKAFFARESYQLRGLGSISSSISGSLLYIDFWRSESGTVFGYGADLEFEDGIYRVAHQSNVNRVVSDDDGTFIVSESSRIKNQLSLTGQVDICANNEEVYKKAKDKTTSSVIFSVSSNADVLPVSKYLFELRKNNGNDLKLFVIEESVPMRASLETVMMECGANMLFPSNASAPFVVNILWQLKQDVYSRTLKKSWEDYQKGLRILSAKGFMNDHDFVEVVSDSLSSEDRASQHHGALVILRCKPDVTDEYVKTSFDPQRNGDIGTILGDYFVAFLLGCQPSYLLDTVPRLFNTPLEKLFDGYQVLFSDSDVMEFLQAWNSQENLSMQKLPQKQVRKQEVPEPEHKQVVFRPKAGSFKKRKDLL